MFFPPGHLWVMATAASSASGRREIDDADAFDLLYRSYQAEVLAYCRRRTNPADAHDAAAEVFTIAWRKIDQVPDGERARTWLLGVAYRVLGHQWRSRRRVTRLRERLTNLGSATEPGPESVVVRRAQDREVIEAAERLRHSDREVLRLAGWEELPHAEIAEILGISVAAVDQRFHRAKKRLAKEYDKIHRPPESGRSRGRS